MCPPHVFGDSHSVWRKPSDCFRVTDISFGPCIFCRLVQPSLLFLPFVKSRPTFFKCHFCRTPNCRGTVISVAALGSPLSLSLSLLCCNCVLKSEKLHGSTFCFHMPVNCSAERSGLRLRSGSTGLTKRNEEHILIQILASKCR